ncbi:MAG: hypothetical protein ACK501_24580 [Planctomycetota bacterium]|jgi:hypothetical protein
MTKTTCLLIAIAAVCSDALAQSNSRGPGYDGALTNISSATYYGRRGAAYPGGELGLAFQNTLCNPGTIPVEWRAPMLPDHPKFSFMVAREVNGRLVQLSDWSYCKHAFLSLNSGGATSPCSGSCIQPPAGGQQLGIQCSDVYTAGNNASRTYLGPPVEIDPWLGTWNPVGSYFDIGDPAQSGYPATADGVRSLNQAVFTGDSVENRVTLREADVQTAVGTGVPLFFQIQVIQEGEPVTNRGNNIMSRPFTLTKTSTAWSTSTTGSASFGSIMSRWTGANMTMGGNGNDDGRFAIAVKVSGPTNGIWHYEYVVHNIDNNRGGASFRLPVCNGARVTNFGFRDIDTDPLNNWTPTYAGGEVAFTAPANNPQNWNTLYNFWFDCDVAPTSGNATIDQARVGPGALTVSVPTTVPGLQPALYLGAGCGVPTGELVINGVPSAGNAGFALSVTGEANSAVLVYFSESDINLGLGGGCNLFLDPNVMSLAAVVGLDGAGAGSLPIPVAPGQTPATLTFQGATLLSTPPLFGLIGLTNGLKVRFAGTGCN